MSKRGISVANPYKRLNREQIELIDRTSFDLLADPGVLCYNEESTALLEKAGARVKPTREGTHQAWWVSIPAGLVREALQTVPSKIVLGARNPANALELDGNGNRVYFGTGSETNYWLELQPEVFVSRESGEERVIPGFKRHRGKLEYLCRSARLADQLDNLDFFIRNVNVQDDDITPQNKDVNVFFAALNHTAKHVMGGIVELNQLEHVVRMAEIIAGGRKQLLEKPVVSFITSLIKSPLQVVDETAEKFLAMARLGLPVVISTSPQGGSTAPIDEAGMLSQVNAEVLTGIVLSQLARPGAPVIYGAVPVRARMDDLHDMYGVPEFCHYNLACAQMARHYGVPCYSTAGVADAPAPGVQASVEKMFTHTAVPFAAPGLVHYAFGLLEKTQTFCPEQAVLDDWQIGMTRFLYREPELAAENLDAAKNIIQEVMHTPHRLYARYARRRLRRGEIFTGFPFAGDSVDNDEALLKASERLQELLAEPPAYLPADTCRTIFDRVPGLVSRLNPYRD